MIQELFIPTIVNTMAKITEEFYPLDSLFQNMAAGRYYSYLTADSVNEMEKIFSSIKFPFHVVSAYALNGKHYALILFSREVKKKNIN